MKLLLDLHIFLWLVHEPQRLPATVTAALQDGNNQRYLSIVSVWELQIKASTGKITLPASVQQFVTEQRILITSMPYPFLSHISGAWLNFPCTIVTHLIAF